MPSLQLAFGQGTAWRRLMWIGAVGLALGLSACGGGAPCGCGAPTSAPISEHNLAFAGEHTVDAQCVCRCGSDAPTAFPADRPCAEYETVCLEPSGERGTRRCN